MTRPSSSRTSKAVALAVLLVGLTVADSGASEPRAILGLGITGQGVPGSPVTAPITLTYFDTSVVALALTLAIDGTTLAFDPADNDQDGVPDSVTLPSGLPSVIYIGYEDNEIDVMLVNLSEVPLPRGVILEFTFQAKEHGPHPNWLRFSDVPPPSFGDAQGQSVDGTVVYFRQRLFADGFESGDTSAWSEVHSTP